MKYRTSNYKAYYTLYRVDEYFHVDLYYMVATQFRYTLNQHHWNFLKGHMKPLTNRVWVGDHKLYPRWPK